MAKLEQKTQTDFDSLISEQSHKSHQANVGNSKMQNALYNSKNPDSLHLSSVSKNNSSHHIENNETNSLNNNLTSEKPQTKDCPFCAEKIALAAKKCKHCNELLDPTLRDIDSLKKNKPLSTGSQIIVKKKFSHFWHFVLTLFTGFWFFIWIIAFLTRDKDVYL